jgi:phosphocarrier protein HPr
MVTMKATVNNTQGIHCRPSGVIYKACEDYNGEICLATSETEVKLTSIMDIIVLGLFKGDSVIIKVSGRDESVMCKKLVDLFEKKYDFPHRKK